jgi:hypothetical protein
VAGSPANPGYFTAGLGHLGLFGAVLWLAAIALTWTTIRPGR